MSETLLALVVGALDRMKVRHALVGAAALAHGAAVAGTRLVRVL